MKNYRIIFFVLFLFFSVIDGACQNRGNVWVFGDSSGIDFNFANNPLSISTGIRSRGSCTSFCDSLGNLKVYVGDRANTPGDYTTLVYNSFHDVMPNGDSIVGEGWYQELILLPFPGNDSLYYLFTVSLLGPLGLYCSIIDIYADSGRGDVISKNYQLQTFPMVDCLTAIKHGNGRDWWLLFKKFNTPNDQFYSYLITPSGLSSVNIQSIGSTNSTNLAKLVFNKRGNKACFSNYMGLLEIYDFNRCSGLLSNPVTILPESNFSPWPSLFGIEFSSSGNLLYVSSHPINSYLIQFDLTSTNITLTGDTIWTSSFPTYSAGDLKRGKDEKIYLTSAYYNGIQFPYPYPDSVYNMYNMNLSVINEPDSLGVACNFQPYSFYLGGKRTYWGLPNNPNYDLGPLTGSPCDTLVSLPESELINATLAMYYHTGWAKAFINAQNLKGHIYKLQIYDLFGHMVYKDEGNLQPPYFTNEVIMTGSASGIYVVRLETDKETLTGKMLISK